MLIFTVKRLSLMILTMLIVSLLLFVLLELQPGNVATKVLGPYSSEEQRTLWLEANGYADFENDLGDASEQSFAGAQS